MPFRTAQHLLGYVGLKCTRYILGALPLEMASKVSGRLWRLVAPHLHRHQRALSHLQNAFPHLTKVEAERIACDMWEMLGRTFAEGFHLEELAQSDRLVIEDAEKWRDFFDNSSKGWIFCAAHCANWEIGASIFPQLGRNDVAGIYQPLTNPYAEKEIYHLRHFLYKGGLFPKGPKAIRNLMRHAREGGIIVCLADLRDEAGLHVPFFGRLAPSPAFPAMIARTLDIPLIAGHMIRQEGVRFSGMLKEIQVPKTSDKAADIYTATAQIQAQFENWIRENPSQWMWAHRRWG